jgi:cytochrome c biogenesis protein CcdA
MRFAKQLVPFLYIGIGIFSIFYQQNLSNPVSIVQILFGVYLFILGLLKIFGISKQTFQRQKSKIPENTPTPKKKKPNKG